MRLTLRSMWMVVVTATLSIACRSEDTSGEQDTSKPSLFGFQRTPEESLLEEGRLAYQRHCVGCHGITGDGKGEASLFLNPKPRNFQLAYFKFSSTRSGQLPTEDDLRRTIRKGLKGSAMPSFELVSDRTVDALISYIKTFSPKWRQRSSASRIPVVEDPYRATPDKSEAIRRGELIYHAYAKCWSCHPAYVSEQKLNEQLVALGEEASPGFRPVLQHSVGKPNVEGELIYPPDFHRDFIRSGSSVEDLYRIIAAGITGTAMPTWVDSMNYAGVQPNDPPRVQQVDLWAMAYYVQNLIKQRPSKLKEGSFEVRDRSTPVYLHGEPPKPVAEEEDVFEE